jgi:hypothetical protein
MTNKEQSPDEPSPDREEERPNDSGQGLIVLLSWAVLLAVCFAIWVGIVGAVRKGYRMLHPTHQSAPSRHTA